MSSLCYVHNRYCDPEALEHQSPVSNPATAFGSYALVGLIGIYTLFKILESLGFPVWLWLHHIMNVAVGPVLRLYMSTAGSQDNSGGRKLPNGANKVLSSVFGLNNGLLGQGVKGVAGSLSKSYSTAPAGLGNWDNSCYQNSVIQGLASLSSLRDYLSETTATYKALGTETMNGALFDMIKQLNNPMNQGQHFWIRGKLKSMSTFQQQDAQEYYSKILDELDKEVQGASIRKERAAASWLLTAKNLSDSSVTTEHSILSTNPLDGLLAQRVGCIDCGHSDGLSMIPFNCITVPLGHGRAYDVRQCLEEYTNLEHIEGVECAKCTLLKTEDTLAKLVTTPDSPFSTRLQAVQDALSNENFDDKTLKDCGITKKNWVQITKSRQAVISRAPKALVLHVNRSIFDEMTGAQLKNTAAVTYPQILDLGPWCLGNQPLNPQNPDDIIEKWPRDPKQSMLRNADLDDWTGSGFQYRLEAVVTHFGSHGNGHYICYRQHPSFSACRIKPQDTKRLEDLDEMEESMRSWWRFSDENVHEVAEAQAMHQGGVFMLFYERINPGHPLSPLEAKTISTIATTGIADVHVPVVEASLVASEAMDIDAAIAAAAVPLPDDEHDNIFPTPPDINKLPLSDNDDPTFTKIPLNIGNRAPAAAGTCFPQRPLNFSHTTVEEDTEMSQADTSNYDSEEAPSTQLTSDEEPEAIEAAQKVTGVVGIPPGPSMGPQWMRTAGSRPRSSDGGRTSLPMVTAT